MRTVLLLFGFVVAAPGQAPIDMEKAPGWYYATFSERTLAAAAETLTVQQPASGAARRVIFRSASVYCSVACNITFRINGTAATATANTVVQLSPAGPTPLATAFSVSDVGVGTKVAPIFAVAAGGTQSFDLTGMELRGSGTAKNLSVSTDAITGNARIQIVWEEVR